MNQAGRDSENAGVYFRCISGLNKKLVFDRLSEYSPRVQEHNNRQLSGLQSTAHTFLVIWLVNLSDQSV